ncbi:MAG TPA: hypothetical protein EYG21_00410 [Nitrospinaceae bacterium]|nr:hypothetical protein [Nitrospinaceae bacterium]
MSEYIFISDYFVDQIVGGGELNDHEVISELKKRKISVSKINSHLVKQEHLKKGNRYIISNFTNLPLNIRESLKGCDYIIYEHDHKYLKRRNPALFYNFEAPKQEIINLEFFQKAKAVLCQSQFHLDVVRKNTDLNNLLNLSGNMWSIQSLNHMSKICKKEKKDKISILDSQTEHKNTKGAIEYCLASGKPYELISDRDYYSFLSKMGSNNKFVFLPKTPETLSRVCVEARMMNMGIVVNDLIGASKEVWFKMKGLELVEHMTKKRKEIVDVILGAF